MDLLKTIFSAEFNEIEDFKLIYKIAEEGGTFVSGFTVPEIPEGLERGQPLDAGQRVPLGLLDSRVYILDTHAGDLQILITLAKLGRTSFLASSAASFNDLGTLALPNSKIGKVYGYALIEGVLYVWHVDLPELIYGNFSTVEVIDKEKIGKGKLKVAVGGRESFALGYEVNGKDIIKIYSENGDVNEFVGKAQFEVQDNAFKIRVGNEEAVLDLIPK